MVNREISLRNNYNACLDFFNNVKSNTYIKLSDIAKHHNIGKASLTELVKLGYAEKISNGLYKWLFKNEEGEDIPLSKEHVILVLDSLRIKAQNYRAEKLEESMCEEVEDCWDPVEEEVKETITEEIEDEIVQTTTCSKTSRDYAFEIMRWLIENKSVELEKAPSTAVSLLDTLYLKLGYEEDNN